MNRAEAEEFAKENYPYDENNDYCALFRIRHKCTWLPEYGADGSERDNSEWAYIDAAGNVDTGLFGEIYYF